jgi:two-component system, cell cycle response regulator
MSDKTLVIDDSPDIHTLVKVRLGKEQVVIQCASDGASGLAAAREFRPDLILLDIDMPERDGFAVCTDLKADSMTRDIPIIFLSGATSTKDKIRGLELGATDYVTKPFDPAELRARVRAALRTAYLMDLLSRKAMIDGLTGLWNRTYLDSRLEAEVAHARRTGRSVSCIMLDVDHFKSINDRYGHPFGDEVLRMIAVALGASCRSEDVVCRYGGEGFAVLLPNTNAVAASELAERLRRAIEGEAMKFKGQVVKVTSSFGVSELSGNTSASVIERADKALYDAKQSGRNCVCVAAISPTEPSRPSAA